MIKKKIKPDKSVSKPDKSKIKTEVSTPKVSKRKSIDKSSDDFDAMFDFETSKHQLEGKHALAYDKITHGLLLDKTDMDIEYDTTTFQTTNFTISADSSEYEELHCQQDSLSKQELAICVHRILSTYTNLDFSVNRRKPNSVNFNSYYVTLLKHAGNKYSKCELFVELSYYFTDHKWNVFKLLEPYHAINILTEMRKKGYLNEFNDIDFI